jgi:uncharacterized protein (DUF302 family)
MQLKKLSILTATAVMLTISTMPLKAMDDWIIKQSPHDVATTADRLVTVIKKAGATVFARIDHQAGAMKAGMEMQPATVVLFGNPKIGTPIMKANPRAAIDLPIKVLIWSEDGKTQIGALDPAALKARYGIEGVEKPFAKMTGALNKLMGVAAGE